MSTSNPRKSLNALIEGFTKPLEEAQLDASGIAEYTPGDMRRAGRILADLTQQAVVSEYAEKSSKMVADNLLIAEARLAIQHKDIVAVVLQPKPKRDYNITSPEAFYNTKSRIHHKRKLGPKVYQFPLF